MIQQKQLDKYLQSIIDNKNNSKSRLCKPLNFLQKTEFQHKKIGIFGRIACGKSTLVKSLLTQAVAEEINIIGVDLTWGNRTSELKEWGECQSSKLPLTIIEIEREKLEYGNLALHDAITRASGSSPSILYINEVDALQESTSCHQAIEDICSNKNINIQVILISQTIKYLSKAIIKSLPNRLVGQMELLDIDTFRKQMYYPEPIIQLCLQKFGSPLNQKYSSWVLDKGEDLTESERFKIYQHYIE